MWKGSASTWLCSWLQVLLPDLEKEHSEEDPRAPGPSPLLRTAESAASQQDQHVSGSCPQAGWEILVSIYDQSEPVLNEIVEKEFISFYFTK